MQQACRPPRPPQRQNPHTLTHRTIKPRPAINPGAALADTKSHHEPPTATNPPITGTLHRPAAITRTATNPDHHPPHSAPRPHNVPQDTPTKRRGSATVRFILRTAAGALAILVAFAFFASLTANAPEPAGKPEEELLRSVRVIDAARVPTPRQWDAFGTARPLNESTVAAQVAGVITLRPDTVEPGNRVDTRDLIARIDPDEYIRRRDAANRRVESLRAQLDGLDVEQRSLAGHQDGDTYRKGRLELAEEAADIAQRELDRAQRAAERNSASPSEVDAFRSQLTAALRTEQQLREQLTLIPSRQKALEAEILSAEADALVAQLNYQRTEIRAERPGTIQEVLIDQGDRVAPGTPVTRIIDLTRIEIPLKVAASATASLRVGDIAQLNSTGTTQQTWQGRIARIAPEADPTDRTITLFIVVDQPPSTPDDRLLRPGQFLNATVTASQPTPRLVVPRTAIREDDTVLTLDNNNTIAVRRVQVDFRVRDSTTFNNILPGESEWAALTENPTPNRDNAGLLPLAEGDRIIVSNTNPLRPGIVVNPQQAQPAPAQQIEKAQLR